MIRQIKIIFSKLQSAPPTGNEPTNSGGVDAIAAALYVRVISPGNGGWQIAMQSVNLINSTHTVCYTTATNCREGETECCCHPLPFVVLNTITPPLQTLFRLSVSQQLSSGRQGTHLEYQLVGPAKNTFNSTANSPRLVCTAPTTLLFKFVPSHRVRGSVRSRHRELKF